MADCLTAVTVDDLLRAGACRDGVLAHKRRLAPHATAVPVDELLQALVGNDDAVRWLLKASYRDGYGNGIVNGNGYGYGYGYGEVP